jgi:ferrous iron transport protein A
MSDRKQVPLTMLKAGQSGKIVQVQGGAGLINRLSALGVRPGGRITKVSSMLMRGPVTVQIGRVQVAMGFGMAKRVMVEVVEAAT